jgi:hypothetical protein
LQVGQGQAAADIKSWLGSEEPGLQLHSLMLLAKGSAQDALFSRSSSQPTLQQLLGGGAPVVGGIAAGSGNLFFSPSSAQPRGPDDSSGRPKIVGLALCSSASCGAAPAGPAHMQAAAAAAGPGRGGSGSGSAPVRAAALSVHGFAATAQDEVWHSIELVRKWGSTQSGVSGCSGLGTGR